MDSRVILAQTHKRDLASVPELAGVADLPPVLTADKPVAPTTKRVTLIVPTFFNTELKRSSLFPLIEGINRAQCINELVIVSSDGEGRRFDELAPLLGACRLRVVESDPHKRGKSRNVGAAAASNELLLFLDDDMLLKDWRVIDVVLARMLAGRYEAALFPRRQYARYPLLFDGQCLQQTVRNWRRGVADPFLCDPLQEGAGDLPMLFCFPGCFMLIARKAYNSIGGFDESFEGWGFEDTEFGLRAIRRLRVLNLFRIGEPLLHIDHPVSPYKSEEHGTNYRKFCACDGAVDVHRFSRTVFTGENFERVEHRNLTASLFSRPFTAVAAEVPMQVEQIEPWLMRLGQQRLHRLLNPLPEFIALHGSRARGTATAESDYDLLCLYRGPVQDFFATRTAPRVELECADLEMFELFAAQPAYFDLRGALELAKIAEARLLWGNAAAWEDWRSSVLAAAGGAGHLFWLVLGLGLQLNAAKYGAMTDRFLASIRAIFTAQQLSDAVAMTVMADRKVFAQRVCAELEAHIPGWREKTLAGGRIFELQVPEIWIALHWLIDHVPVAAHLDERQCASLLAGRRRRRRAAQEKRVVC